MNIHSIRFKASVLFSTILCIILVAYSAYLYYTDRRILYADLDGDLRIKAQQISGILEAYTQVNEMESQPLFLMHQFLAANAGMETNRNIIDQLWAKDVQSLHLEEDYFHILNSAGRSTLHSQNFSKKVVAIFAAHLPFNPDRLYFADLRINNLDFRAVNYPFVYNNKIHFILQVATPLTGLEHILGRLFVFIIGGVVVILILTSSMGAYFAKRILRPVNAVTETADRLSQKDLSVRIREEDEDQEMRTLIQSLNHMLERLEKSFSHVNEFSSHVAHELKTPLAIIKGEIELALSTDNSTEEYQRVLTTSLQEVDRLIKIVKDLLLLAKLDYNPDVFKFEEIDLTAFLKDLHQHGQILTTPKGIQLNLDVPERQCLAEADVVHLRRLFYNLIHNAVKFTPQGGRITIGMELLGQDAVISISDTGQGIAEEDLRKIFDKFYRAANADPAMEHGTGLGLNIAQSIARAHRGDITVISKLQEGTTFTVRIPLLDKRRA